MIKNYPYRIKTEEEMIRDFGEYWSNSFSCGWNPIMYDLLGIDYPDMDIDITKYNDTDYLNRRFPGVGSWTIMPCMLTKNKPRVPDYTPRKIIREI